MCMKVQAQLCPFLGDCPVVVDSFFNVSPIGLRGGGGGGGGGLRVWSLLSYVLLGVLSSFAIILTRKREHDILL